MIRKSAFLASILLVASLSGWPLSARSQQSNTDANQPAPTSIKDETAKPFGPPPIYPAEEARRGIGGTAIVYCDYAADGMVISAGIKSSSGNKNLDNAAVAAIKLWKIDPRTDDGHPKAGQIVVPFEFTPPVVTERPEAQPTTSTNSGPVEASKPNLFPIGIYFSAPLVFEACKAIEPELAANYDRELKNWHIRNDVAIERVKAVLAKQQEADGISTLEHLRKDVIATAKEFSLLPMERQRSGCRNMYWYVENN